MVGNGSRWRWILLVCAAVVLLSATMANGIRTGVIIDGTGRSAPGRPAAAAHGGATGVAAAATAAARVGSDDPYNDSKRKVPSGPDPIHNRRARWGDAPAKENVDRASVDTNHIYRLDQRLH